VISSELELEESSLAVTSQEGPPLCETASEYSRMSEPSVLTVIPELIPWKKMNQKEGGDFHAA